MTTWQPDLAKRSGPRYVAIADALASDLEQGRLAAGQRLPTHRDLAWRLGVTVGTVTRAYAEAERRGLVTGEVGRGTFIREPAVPGPVLVAAEEQDEDFIDLAYNFPPSGGDNAELAPLLAELAQDPRLGRIMGYEMGHGRARHRAAAVRWLAQAGLSAKAEEIAVSAGAQHGMLLALGALTRPGDVILAEELSYYGIKSLAGLLDLRLQGVAMDGAGLLPEALDAACRSSRARVLYCIPTLQNPTAAVMPDARRQEIAEVCRRHGVTVVEDDVYGFLPETTQAPLTQLLPAQSVYVTSLSKSVSPGLRIGFVKAPESLMERITQSLRASTLMAPPLMGELAARLIESGAAGRVALWQRGEAAARQTLAAEILAGLEFASHPQAFHLWLKLPEPWRREVFTAQARSRGVGVAPAEVFAVGRQPVPHAVRICLQAAAKRSQVERALRILAAILAERPGSHLPVV